jgi:hydrogenase 3 maturation protease
LTLVEDLATWLRGSGKVAVLGVGNSLRRDDSVGLSVVKKLSRRVSPNVGLYECETVPENFMGQIERLKPTHILMVDAADMKATPGEIRLVPPEEIGGLSVSTHALPLSVFARFMKQSIDAKVVLLAIQPKNVDFGTRMTRELQSSARIAADAILQALSARG